MNVAVWSVIGYVAGALPSAWLLARLTGHADDLRRASRNSGETDAHLVLKEAGAGRAATVAGALDVIKAFVPVLVAVLVSGTHETAACTIGAVAGHCWPPALGRYGGRGLSAAAGAFLAMLPVEMVIGGAITALGNLAGVGGLASTIGFVGVAVIAMLRGQPAPLVIAAWVVNAMIIARRLEGVGGDIERGVPVARAVWRRAIFDVSAVRDERRAAEGA